MPDPDRPDRAEPTLSVVSGLLYAGPETAKSVPGEPTTACSGAATDVRESECMQGKWLPRACIVWSRLSNSAPERSGSWESHTQPQQACSPAGCLSAARVIGAIWYCGSRPGKLSDIRKRSRETQTTLYCLITIGRWSLSEASCPKTGCDASCQICASLAGPH